MTIWTLQIGAFQDGWARFQNWIPTDAAALQGFPYTIYLYIWYFNFTLLWEPKQNNNYLQHTKIVIIVASVRYDCTAARTIRKEMFLNMFMTKVKVWDGLKLDHIILNNLNHVTASTRCPTHWPVLHCVPLGTEWLLISANCLWVRAQTRTLPATSARMNKHLVSSHSTVGDGEMCNGGVIEREGKKKSSLVTTCSAALRCGDSSGEQLWFRWSSSLWSHGWPWEKTRTW